MPKNVKKKKNNVKTTMLQYCKERFWHMTKHFVLKRLLIGLLLFCGIFAYASFHTAYAFSVYDSTMEAFCDSWSENMLDYQ